jgi:hypothetical protein
MALSHRRTKAARATGHVSHDAQLRIDARVARILARRGSDRPAVRTAAGRPTEAGNVGPRREP